MKDGICPKCKSGEVYTSADDTHGIRVPLSWRDVPTNLYVCTVCGYLEFYVQYESDLEKIRLKLKKVN